MTQAYFHYLVPWVEMNVSHKVSGKWNVGAKRDATFRLLLYCGHCFCLGLLSIRVCVTWTMLAVGCLFHMHCLIWQLVYLSHFIDTAPHW